MRKRLTRKQEKFAHKYIQNDGNATKAALEVYDTDDYDTASQLGHKNLTNPAVRSLIKETFKKEELTTEYVLAHLKADIEYTDEPNPYRTRSLEMIAKHLNMFDEKPKERLNNEQYEARRKTMMEEVAKLIEA